MIGKKDYQLFADTISLIDSEEEREKIMAFLFPIFRNDNSNFSEDRFRDWIKRRQKNESMKGTHYNPNYMPLGVS